MNIEQPKSMLEAGSGKIPLERIFRPFVPWVAVKDALPPQCRKVLVTYKNELGNSRIVLAERYEPLTVECDCEYECECDYDEKKDCYYIPAGWWEVSENHDEFQLMFIGDEITHWMFLPVCP